ncbi:hypothetical protein [Methylophaga sp.]|jgi:hypothetical protein|uniref:hypothetical protein n=1 Tax=Methylophaga sp. TaxID=2024840 RepID=UPI000C0E6E67|nr:hypothetical protein [Methylophaga sp.]MBL1458327.1 hypothetical protein [Methylophaga sp.]|tara:strand:- start:97 stop:330 length:234 start_codon:yes stop_codon:yes gene_type:complete
MRSAIFLLLILATIVLATFPIFFTWANRVEPSFIGLPFAFLWQIAMALLGAFFLACWYLVESRSGDLDIEVESEASK